MVVGGCNKRGNLRTSPSWESPKDVVMSHRSPKHAIERHTRWIGAGTTALTVSSTGVQKGGQPEPAAPDIFENFQYQMQLSTTDAFPRSLPNLK